MSTGKKDGSNSDRQIELLQKQLQESKQEAEYCIKVAESLRETMTILNSDRPLDEVLDYIVSQAGRLLGAGAVAIYRIYPEEKMLRIQAAQGLDPDYVEDMAVPVGQFAVGRAVVSNKPVAISDIIEVSSDPGYQKASQKQKRLLDHLVTHYRAILAVPMVIKDEVYGGITLYFSEPHDFSEEEIQLAVGFCDYAALAIENARLLDQTKQRAEIAEGLRDILTILNSNHSLDEILDYICTQTSRLANTDAVGIYRYDPDKGVLRIQASRGINGGYASKREVPTGEGIVGQAVAKRQTLIVSDMTKAFQQTLAATKDENQKKVTEQFLARYKALLAVPLVVGDEPYGAIALFYPEVREFTEEEIVMATAFGNQAALAVENARLRAKIEQAAVEAERNRLARELHDAVTQTLFSASVIAEVLPRLWERDENEGRKRLDELRTLTRGALAEMRALLLELRPKALAESDMGDLLNQLAEAANAAQISTEVKVEGECSVPVDVKIALYRIAQEAMNNVMRHSGATKAWILLHCESDQIDLEIRDDGKGFDPKRMGGDSLELGIMHERAQAIGAHFSVQSRLGQGTRIKALWTDNEKKKKE